MKRHFSSTNFLQDDAGGKFQQLLLQRWLLLREFPLVRDLHREIMLRVFLLLLLLHAPHTFFIVLLLPVHAMSISTLHLVVAALRWLLEQ